MRVADRKAACLMFRLALLLSLLLVATAAAMAERLPIKAYTTADGLAYNGIRRIVRDSHGFLWACTPNGLSRFDGARFKTYNMEDGLPVTSSYDLLETGNGTYWLATNGGGVARFNFTDGSRPLNRAASPSRFTVHSLNDNPVANRVNKLFEDRAGTVWAGTDGGLFSLNEARGEYEFHGVELGIRSHPDLSVQVWSFAQDNDGDLWIGTKFGLLHRRPDGQMIHYEVHPSLVSDMVYSLVKDNAGNLWMSHDTAVIACKLPAAAESQMTRGQSLHLLPQCALVHDRRWLGRQSHDCHLQIFERANMGFRRQSHAV